MIGQKFLMVSTVLALALGVSFTARATPASTTPGFPYPNGVSGISREDVLAHPEFFGGSKLRALADGRQPLGTSASSIGIEGSGGFMYVSLDAGHGVTYGNNCTSGCTTGAIGGPEGLTEDEMNRRLTLKVYNKLDASAEFLPAVSRWVQNNNKAPGDWDYSSSTLVETQPNRPDRAWFDYPPYTDNPNLDYSLSDNEYSNRLDRAAHANQIASGSHSVGKVLVSLHFNKGGATQSGPFIVVNSVVPGATQTHQDKSKQLGLAICNRMLTARFGAGHGKTCYVQVSDITVLRETKDTIPAVIIEGANFDNASDMSWLGTGTTLDQRLDAYAEAIYQGIRDYYSAT